MVKTILIPQGDPHDYWAGTTGVPCGCGGAIEWAEAAYTPGISACRSCCRMFMVCGDGAERRLVPQVAGDDGIGDAAGGECEDESSYRVPQNLYPGWHQPAASVPAPG